MAGASTADAAANMERGSVPSSIELRGSVGADDEEEEDEEVLPLRAPRRVLVSVTWCWGGQSRRKLRNCGKQRAGSTRLLAVGDEQ